MYEIPYHVLLLMQKDKLRVAYGDVMEEVSEEEFMKLKGIKYAKK